MIYDLAIIGGASAGLTAGIYAGRKKLKTILLSKNIGGQSLLTEMIENFPGWEKISGPELIKIMKEQNEKYGVEIKEGEEVKSIEKKGNNFLINSSLETKTVIIATGQTPRRLNIPGEKEFEGRGVSFCSTCDAPLFEKKEVAVVGSGNSGLCGARDLLKYARKVYVLESRSNPTGDEWMVEELRRSGRVEFILKAEIKEIRGNKFVEKIIYNNDKELAVNGIFINIGWFPASELVRGLVNLNERDEIIINPKTNETSVEGIFAAGDVTDIPYKQLVIAAGEGAKAALSVYQYLLNLLRP
jgi:thioredoxin-disulfide reductase